MKDSKILAEAYVKGIYKEGCDDPIYNPDIYQSKRDYIAGFNSGKKLRWNSVNIKLPKSDHQCVCWVENKEVPHWSKFGIGCYQNNKWYLQNGRETHEIVTDWIKIEKAS